MSEKYEFIMNLIQEAGEVLLASRDKNLAVFSKDGDEKNILTNVDIEVNDFVTKRIQDSFPDDLIYSEESKNSLATQNFWSVDPIDGTSNFARGIPHFAVVISFIEGGEAVVGSIYNPITKELFSFEKGQGAFLNGEEIRVSSIDKLGDAYVLLHIGRKESVEEWGISLQRRLLREAKKNNNLGSSALDLAFLASGRVDAVIYGTMTTQDIAVAIGLVREAGGEVYDVSGNKVDLSDTPQQVVAVSNKALFSSLNI